MTPFDKVGREITVGAFIAYGHALGRCAALRVGRVLAIKAPAEGCQEWHHYGGGWRITVIGISDDYRHRAPELNSRKGVLQFPSRMLVLDSVSETYRQMLENYAP